eukprot:3677257-Rhodomonas_salina.5
METSGALGNSAAARMKAGLPWGRRQPCHPAERPSCCRGPERRQDGQSQRRRLSHGTASEKGGGPACWCSA